jgi:hypothetical protein
METFEVAEADQIDLKEIGPGKYQLCFPYNPDFIQYLKTRVPAQDRSYDPDTHFWEVRGEQYIPAIEGIAVRKFSFATKIFWRDGKQVWRNLKSGAESIQENLF